MCYQVSVCFLQAENPSEMNEENEVIMAILRGIYERRQLQHTHIGQVIHNPHLLLHSSKASLWVWFSFPLRFING